MNKNEFKKMLKPLIKECIREVIFEEGALSSVVSEVVKGMGQPLVETKQAYPTKHKPRYETDEEARIRLEEKKKHMRKAIGIEAYNGVNVFEGTTPAAAPINEGHSQGPLSGVAPEDPGVDISSFMGKSSAIWSKMAGK